MSKSLKGAGLYRVGAHSIRSYIKIYTKQPRDDGTPPPPPHPVLRGCTFHCLSTPAVSTCRDSGGELADFALQSRAPAVHIRAGVSHSGLACIQASSAHMQEAEERGAVNDVRRWRFSQMGRGGPKAVK